MKQLTLALNDTEDTGPVDADAIQAVSVVRSTEGSMTSSTEETARADDLKALLEAIAGHEIDASTEQLKEQLIKLVVPVGSYAFTGSGDTVGHITSKNLVIFRPPICTTDRLLDVSGVSTTSAAGNRSFLVGDFICPEEGTLFYDEPINVVATPRSASPFFLTMTYSLVFPPNSQFATNLQITVFAWDANGAAAPDVQFDWRCRVRSTVVIL